MINPERRLGVGTGENSYESLKQHPFFRGIDFDSLFRDPVPFGFLPEFEQEICEDDQDLEDLNIKNFTVIHSGLIKKKSGLLCKSKIGRFFNKRVLTLTSQPKLYYSDAGSVYKGEIPLSGQLVAELGSRKEFVIHVPGRDYYFKEIDDSPQTWVNCLNEMVKDFF